MHEARGGESRADFIHKVSIAQKEAHEAVYWITLIKRSHLLAEQTIVPYEREAREILAILTAILKRSRENNASPK